MKFNKIRILLISCGLSFLPFLVLSADRSDAYSFLDITSSAKIYGLGGINISAVDAGVEAVDQNPALLGPEYDRRLGLGYMRWVGSSNFASLIFGTSIGERSAWSLGVRYFGYGEIQRTDVDGAVLGSVSPVDFIAGASYSRDITDMFRGGATLNVIYSSYGDYTAVALGVNLGVNYYDSERDLSLSATVMNLGGQVKRFENTYERLPIDVRLGWTQSFPGFPVRFSVTAWNLTRWKLPYYKNQFGFTQTDEVKSSFASDLFRHLVFGADIIPSDKFYISLGYNYKIRTDMSSYSRNFISGVSLGCGLKTADWAVSIAFAQPHQSASTLMLNISASLGQFLGN